MWKLPFLTLFSAGVGPKFQKACNYGGGRGRGRGGEGRGATVSFPVRPFANKVAHAFLASFSSPSSLGGGGRKGRGRGLSRVAPPQIGCHVKNREGKKEEREGGKNRNLGIDHSSHILPYYGKPPPPHPSFLCIKKFFFTPVFSENLSKFARSLFGTKLGKEEEEERKKGSMRDLDFCTFGTSKKSCFSPPLLPTFDRPSNFPSQSVAGQ